jgi:hypothetical protein
VAIEAVQLGPTEFIVAAEQLRVGDEFAVDDDAWLVVGEPVEVAAGSCWSWSASRPVRNPGDEFDAHVRVGRRVAD